ncbi:hypothetical protein [Aquamicrobium defluvii]|uniref:hypothetical protein n=1 Tax=Aquamicrobium defluvii TaxID=69279 RepID=UPI000451F6FD|nr:hypothetical protein [Aquamicrobium defluvii]EZQ13598.1 hypothetical protein CF98_27155 [Halopseudomonas bauzanensis]
MTVFPDQVATDYDQRILRLVAGYEPALDLAAGYLASHALRKARRAARRGGFRKGAADHARAGA